MLCPGRLTDRAALTHLTNVLPRPPTGRPGRCARDAYASPLATRKLCATFEGDFLSIETAAFICWMAGMVSSALTLLMRFGERRALGREHALLDDGCDVLEAEHVLGVAEHLELAAEQLPVGGEHELHADLPAFERLVGEFDGDRLERRHDAIDLLESEEALEARGKFGRPAERHATCRAASGRRCS